MELNFHHRVCMTTESRALSRPSTFTPTALCLQRMALTDDIQKFTLLVQGASSTLESLKRFRNYNGEDPFVTAIQNPPLEYTKLHDLAVKLVKNFPKKRKENDDGFIMPPLSKVNKLASRSSQLIFQLELKNKFLNLNEETARISTETATKNTDQNNPSQQTTKNLPPPDMLKVQLNYMQQIKEITNKMHFVREKLTGEYLKLYTNTFEQQ
ncbi:hypothetical protein TNCV_252521 [Trichonephila clavipes]|nr:hypothetical protein TNCV_252521 [Trichonephila clavipes]